MSDTDSNADSNNDAEPLTRSITGRIRKLCDRLRANDPRILINHDGNDSIFAPFYQHGMYIGDDYSDAEFIAVFQALKENTSVTHIDFSMLFERGNYTFSTY
jgi:hypothetical protein